MQVPNIVRALVLSGDSTFAWLCGYLNEAGIDLHDGGAMAHKWCQAQAERGVPEAQVALAELLITGIGVTQEKTTAVKWCQEAVNSGLSIAFYMLAGFYSSGWEGQQPDFVAATDYLNRAAALGYKPAVTSLAVSYLNGLGVELNVEKAVALLRDAASNGYAAAQVLLGSRLVKSDKQEDVQEGIKWIKIAADNRSASAKRHLANFYLMGRFGLSLDTEMAEHHFSEADRIDEERIAALLGDFA